VKPYYDHGGIVLYHGDCLTMSAWLAADVLVTDPPYGMAFVSSWTTQRRPIAGDKDTALRDAVLALWGTEKPAAVFGTWKVARPANTAHRLVWDKSDGTGPGMGDLAAAFGNSDEEVYLLGDWPKRGNRQANVLRTSSGMASLATTVGHPTPKPVDLMERILRAAAPGVVADPFAGSGSTLVAAKNLGRSAIGVELREDYCEIAAIRLRQEVLDFGAA
jgi:DNA modification methylase